MDWILWCWVLYDKYSITLCWNTCEFRIFRKIDNLNFRRTWKKIWWRIIKLICFRIEMIKISIVWCGIYFIWHSYILMVIRDCWLSSKTNINQRDILKWKINNIITEKYLYLIFPAIPYNKILIITCDWQISCILPNNKSWRVNPIDLSGNFKDEQISISV